MNISNIKKIHLIAICGAAMASVAAMLKEMGFEVTGSDANVYPPMSDFLKNRGIEILEGFKAENLLYSPDLVIIGNTVSKDNPEALQVIKAGLNYCSMPQAINNFACSDKKILLISGTHGKTTTSSLLAWILFKAGLEPSFIIGGILKNFDSSYRIGSGSYIVIEGDEYDTAFFDKRPKFLHYDPHITILTNIEFDHADIYKDLEHVKTSFEALLNNISQDGSLFMYDDDKNIDSVIERKNRDYDVKRYGQKINSDIRIENISFTSEASIFDIFIGDKFFYTFKTKMIGEHNLTNAAAAIGAAISLNIDAEKIAEGLETFSGVKRRQEIRGIKSGITVIDDFAHHPTAVTKTIKAVVNSYRPKRLIAVFEPRTNSSMRNVFQNQYAESFDQADIICIKKPSFFKRIPENERISSEKLTSDLEKRGKKTYLFSETDKLIDFTAEEAKTGDIVLIMSNGGFDNIHDKLLLRLK